MRKLHQNVQSNTNCTNYTNHTSWAARPENLSEIRQEAPNPANTSPADCNLARLDSEQAALRCVTSTDARPFLRGLYLRQKFSPWKSWYLFIPLDLIVLDELMHKFNEYIESHQYSKLTTTKTVQFFINLNCLLCSNFPLTQFYRQGLISLWLLVMV